LARITITMNPELYSAAKRLMQEQAYSGNFSAYISEVVRGDLHRRREEGAPSTPANMKETLPDGVMQIVKGIKQILAETYRDLQAIQTKPEVPVQTGEAAGSVPGSTATDQRPARPPEQKLASPSKQMKSRVKHWHWGLVDTPWMTRSQAADYLHWCTRTIDRNLVSSKERVPGKIRCEIQVIDGAKRIRLLGEDVYAICPLPPG
jgi:hypothetical protein